jgi:ATP-dependent DNA helicase RecQ
MQFKAGYIVDSIAKVITDFKANLDKIKQTDRTQIDQINGLLQYVCSFDVDFPYEHNPNFKELNPVLAVINNIITRGLPTRAPVSLEKLLAKINLIEETISESIINYNNSNTNISYDLLFELLHIIEPGLDIIKYNYLGKLDSHLEWEFIGKHPFLKQIIQPQRKFDTINGGIKGERSVDFCFTSPYLHYDEQTKNYKNYSRIFEIDGPHHLLSEYKYYDAKRDSWADDENFSTLRFNISDIKTDKIKFDELICKKQYKIFEKNYNRKIEDKIPEYYLIFIPLAVARIQKALIELLIHKTQNDPDFFKRERIRLAIIERDLPCGAIAIETFQEILNNINDLLFDEEKYFLPKIELTIYDNPKWLLSKEIHLNANIHDETHFKQNEFDIIIDHSILRRSNIYKESDYVTDNAIKIRSSHYYDTSFGKSRRVYCADLLYYPSFVDKKDDGTYEPKEEYKDSINFFIQNIFRKVSFWEGQLPLISRALQQKPVIGLLPTGGGKSLAYQLPAFLQPGLCLVVDPIKSLMEDQVRVLKQNWIDGCDFINSNIKRDERIQKIINFKYGETMILFVSPERLVIQEFRNLIQRIDSSDFGLAFSYCVIDEVHCVSEWGHDFRTTYLMLGKNAQKFAKSRSSRGVNLIGLTATASFDVLTDIERELKIDTEESADAIISIDNTIRPELFFNLVESNNKPSNFPIKEQSLKDLIGFDKQALLNEFYEDILEVLNSIDENVVRRALEQHFRDFEIIENEEKIQELIELVFSRITKSFDYKSNFDPISIIFCPHITGTFGITREAHNFPKVKEVFENLTVVPIDHKGFFMGGDDKVPKQVIEKAQKYFVDFLEGKIHTMVCTKAFGMGIDIESIRAINHINFSSSPESYIQEAGRAGRDKAKSVCNIYFDGNHYFTLKSDFFVNNNQFKLISDRRKARGLIEEYGSFQNRIQVKYFESENQLISKYGQFGVSINEKDILVFNQDKSVHDFFHNNSFKGVETEVYQLNRLMNYNEGINTTRLKLVTEKYNTENVDNINLNLTTNGKWIGNMLINNANGEAIGKIFTNNNSPTATIHGLPPKQSPNIEKTNEILEYLLSEWKEVGAGFTTLCEFLQEEIKEGLNEGKSLIEFFNDSNKNIFDFTVPTIFEECKLEEKIENDFGLNNLAIHAPHSTVRYLECLNAASYNFDDFILRIEEEWNMNLKGTPAFNKNKKEYIELYYSEIKIIDVQRIIYRLYSVGLIEDYTIDYNLGLITFTLLKKKKEDYIRSTQQHMLKYLSRSKTLEIIKELKEETREFDTFKTIQKCVKRVLEFTYNDIVAKRKEAIDDLFKFIIDSKTQAESKVNSTNFNSYWFNHLFKDELYYYFNAKYARKGFKINGEPFSLTDDTAQGRISKWNDFEKYANVLNKQNRFISECKMMRGSCKRIWRTLSKVDYESEFVLKVLYAFSTFGLNNKFYYDEAQENLVNGFYNFYKTSKNYESLKSKLVSFEELIKDSTNNHEFIPFLESAKQHIMLLVNIEYTNELNKKLQAI